MDEKLGVVTQKKYCADCGRLIGSYPGMDYHIFFRLKYCPDCAKTRRRESNRAAQRKYRKTRSETNRILRNSVKAEKERADKLQEALEHATRLVTHYRNLCVKAGMPVYD